MAAEKPRPVDHVGACPLQMSSMSSGYSSGEYSRSASWITTRSPVTAAKPRRERRALAARSAGATA